jgi:hypothetical protein
MTEAELAAKSRNHVQAYSQNDVYADYRKKTDGICAHYPVAPVNPLGLIMRTTIKKRKAMASLSRNWSI